MAPNLNGRSCFIARCSSFIYISASNLTAANAYIFGGIAKAGVTGLRPAAYTTAPDFVPGNVPTCLGSKFVSGFQIRGGGQITYYTDAKNADECFNLNVEILPVGISSRDIVAVLEYLGNPELDVYSRQ